MALNSYKLRMTDTSLPYLRENVQYGIGLKLLIAESIIVAYYEDQGFEKMLTAALILFANIHIYQVRKGTKDSCLNSYIEACCVWMLFLFAVTEILSQYHTIRFIAIFTSWVLFDIVLLMLLAVQMKASGYRIGNLRSKCKEVRELLRYPYYAVLWLIGAAVLLFALCMTPYNWDSMTYHLPRIVYWVQNRSVEHYATNSIRQIASPVLGEFVNLHVYILSGKKDVLFNMLQAGSYITCAFLVGAIAHKIGCDRVFKFIAVLLYMTMPIAFAEALTTQVDNFASVWLLFYVYVLLDLIKQEKKLECKRDEVVKVCTLAFCVAWGYLTKPSVCIAMLIFAVWLLIRCIVRKDKVRDLILLICCSLPCVTVPMIPELLRNFKTFHSFASKGTGARQLIGTLQPSYLIVNFIKNFTFNLPTVLIKDSQVFFAKIAAKAAAILNVDLNAASISEDGREFMLHDAGTYGCDTAINPIIMWLFIICAVWALCMVRRTGRKCIANSYSAVSAISFCVFCAILRWEPFVTRYMVSYLALLCPMIAAQIQLHTASQKSQPFRHGIVGVICFLCIMETVGIMTFHYDIFRHQGANSRPYGYFVHQRGEFGYYAEITDEIKSHMYQSVGLYMPSGNDYEYPIWRMLDGQRIEHINVQNESEIYAKRDFSPECIIWIGRQLPEEAVTVNGQIYTKIQDFGENYYLITK